MELRRMHCVRAWMRAKVALMVLLVSVLFIAAADAGIDDTFDWENNKRTLKIKIDDPAKKLGDKTIKEVMDEAMANWNNANTGWKFEYAGATDTPDIGVSVGTITNGAGNQVNSGGGVTSGFGPKVVTKLDIKFDPKPKEGFKWGMAGKDKMDPVGVAKHELGHTLRLDHEGAADSGHLADPLTPGNHERTPSDRDKRHAGKAALVPTKKNVAIITPGQSVQMVLHDWSHDEGPSGDLYPYLELPGMTTTVYFFDPFSGPVTVEMYQSKGASVPDRYSMPQVHSPYERYVRGVTLIVDPCAVATGEWVSIDILYFDNVLDMDPAIDPELLDLADPKWGRIIDETRLYPVIWNPIEGHWQSIPPSMGEFWLYPDYNQACIFIAGNLLTQFTDEDGNFATTIGIGGPIEVRDCNGNGIDDGDDLGDAYSSDQNANGIPDECEPCPELLPGDISGPDGVPDCCVNLIDLSAMALNWTECNYVPVE